MEQSNVVRRPELDGCVSVCVLVYIHACECVCLYVKLGRKFRMRGSRRALKIDIDLGSA